MKYKVIRYFTDAQDNEYAYREGDTYPREGLNVSEQRIKDLLSGNNFQRVALIAPDLQAKVAKKEVEEPKKEVEEPKKEEEVKWTEEEILKMPFMKLKSVAKQNGVETKDREASDIRSELIEKLVEV